MPQRTTRMLFLEQNVFRGLLHQTHKWVLNNIPTLQHTETIDEHYGIHFPKCHHAAASAYEGRKRGGKPVNITGARLCCVRVLVFLGSTTSGRLYKWTLSDQAQVAMQLRVSFPLQYTDFSRFALAGERKNFFIGARPRSRRPWLSPHLNSKNSVKSKRTRTRLRPCLKTAPLSLYIFWDVTYFLDDWVKADTGCMDIMYFQHKRA